MSRQNASDSDKSPAGHRQRLRNRFLAGDEHSDEALLELLLTYAIAQKDVKPLAETLIARFGSLTGVLAADTEKLCEVAGVGESTAVLLKLVDWFRGS